MIEITELDELLNTLATSALEPHEEYKMEFSNKEQKLIYNYINQLQQDLLHLIENNTLKTNECYRAIKELRNVRIERRRIKNDIELFNTFKLHKNQMLSIENRKFLKELIDKKQNQLFNSKYKNRVYTNEELKNILGVQI